MLELLTSHVLYRDLPDTDEGQMTKIRIALVRESNLARAAREIDLGSALELGVGEQKTGGREKDSILSDAMEALIGALYLDGGLSAAEKLIVDYVFTDLGSAATEDSKSRLQEYLQQNGSQTIYYQTAEANSEGSFVSSVFVGDKELGKGTGTSKKNAEQAAAAEALRALGASKE